MKQKKNSLFTTKNLVYGALFAALAIVLGRFTAVYPAPGVKYTLDKFVLFMSGMFLGPIVGGVIGFIADCLGGTVLGTGWLPQLCIPAVLYGVFGGLFQKMLKQKFSLWRLAIGYLFPIVIGSILYQSPVLAATYSVTTFWQATGVYLANRTVQFAIMFVLETTLIYFLINTGIFSRAGLWPRIQRNSKGNQ